ncbi:photosystem II reaction center protein Psb28 [Leptothoe spongobia]|uniref:Photosystem II reaction center Psb28 protein n=1 Tax=Leptothoe spongobia TAU-MAC 1115 TaxID=1967444 RepID=A0A947DF77_9CYAN|nr:photosystem II reaction center protein Psb28 [Leptothoe spongobia]MBT9315932.1 photosystem II reaction center protein Psb28 [Leptothoe spongobia TAU-MAC 1115]
MSDQIPSVQIFKDIPEEISGVSLRRDPSTGIHIAVIRFEALASIEHFLSFRKSSRNALHLIDTEGEILIMPSGVKMFYGDIEGEDLKGVECKIEIDQDDHWERFIRFMHRYAEANGLDYNETESE